MTAAQQRGLAALLTEKTLVLASEKSGISVRSLTRWLQQAEFLQAYNSAKRQIVESAISELQNASNEAVATLKRNLTAKSEAVQIAAARTILDYGVASISTLDLEQRLAELEAALDALTPKKRLHAIK